MAHLKPGLAPSPRSPSPSDTAALAAKATNGGNDIAGGWAGAQWRQPAEPGRPDGEGCLGETRQYLRGGPGMKTLGHE